MVIEKTNLKIMSGDFNETRNNKITILGFI